MLNSREKRGIVALCAVLALLTAVILTVRYCERRNMPGGNVNISPSTVLVSDTVGDNASGTVRHKNKKKTKTNGKKKKRKKMRASEAAGREIPCRDLRNDPVPVKGRDVDDTVPGS